MPQNTTPTTVTHVIWKHGEDWRRRELKKGDGRGPKSDTGFTRTYVWERENNHTVSDMDPADLAFLRSLPDGEDFRFVTE